MEGDEKAESLLEIGEKEVVDEHEDLVGGEWLCIVFPPVYHAVCQEGEETDC